VAERLDFLNPRHATPTVTLEDPWNFALQRSLVGFGFPPRSDSASPTGTGTRSINGLRSALGLHFLGKSSPSTWQCLSCQLVMEGNLRSTLILICLALGFGYSATGPS